jgi:1,4-dihydroxy-2-naphthoate octaprenyltransferase
MPILLMGLGALAVFMVMGLMLFYAAYRETKTEHEIARKKVETLSRS